MKTNTTLNANAVSKHSNLQQLLQQSSFREVDQIDNFVKRAISSVKKGLVSKSEILDFFKSFKNEVNDTIQSHALLKPYGYSGDFKMIDKIYTNYTSQDTTGRTWDEYFHAQAAPKAVRNRKDYFKSIMTDSLSQCPNIDLLNIASGPARDLKEVYDTVSTNQSLHSTCVDIDANAIDYAQNLNASHLDNIEFVNKNIFKFNTNKKYDIVWSAGLFDYFNDKAFVLCLRKILQFCKPGGEVVVGNFNANHNPSKDYMEIFGDWYLEHRDEQTLIDLAIKAGVNEENISIGRESENVNLFLHVKNV